MAQVTFSSNAREVSRFTEEYRNQFETIQIILLNIKNIDYYRSNKYFYICDVILALLCDLPILQY